MYFNLSIFNKLVLNQYQAYAFCKLALQLDLSLAWE